MENRVERLRKMQTVLDTLKDRLETAQAESLRVAASRQATERNLTSLGRKLAALETELAAVTGKKVRAK